MLSDGLMLLVQADICGIFEAKEGLGAGILKLLYYYRGCLSHILYHRVSSYAQEWTDNLHYSWNTGLGS